MKTLILSIGMLFATALAGHAIPYPPDIPNNFTQANIHVFCEQRKPTPIYQRAYVMLDKWVVVVIGRDTTDLFLLYYDYRLAQDNDVTYAMTPDGWQKMHVHGKNEDYPTNLFTSEELQFLTVCNNFVR